MKKNVKGLFLAIFAIALTACNSNDDGVLAGIEIPGMPIPRRARSIRVTTRFISWPQRSRRVTISRTSS